MTGLWLIVGIAAAWCLGSAITTVIVARLVARAALRAVGK